ncbi:AAA family ATPase [Amycolatopsis sp. NPDC023774]|uniref:AAA family ATPase n=1 Tax=Amycolatopsis sp. NPDC023774 TaxID=3155015 RepID=UPI0033FB5529
MRGQLAPRLRGRERDLRVLAGLLAGAREGRGGALVIRGEAGIGKTALVTAALATAGAVRVAEFRGAESETEFAYAGLHQLCAGLLDRIAALPGQQQAALQVAFGIAGGTAPDHLLVARAIGTLLRESAADQPLVCVVDDAHWVDRASLQALAFVARQCPATPVALVFTVCEPAASGELAGLPELRLDGLGDEDVRALLAVVLPGRLDERVRDRIVAEARGNPSLLLTYHRGHSPAELAGGFGPAEVRPVVDRIERSFVCRIRQLPPSARTLLLVAAADSTGDGALLRQAADCLGVGFDPDAVPDLVTIGERVRFRHPLIRSAAYGCAPLSERRQAHHALATAFGRHGDDEQRVWHLAHAAGAPDEALAAELACAAELARARGGVGAAAAFLSCAVELTPEPGSRVDRILAAAQAKLDASAPADAAKLMILARAAPMDELQRARVERMCAKIALDERGAGALPLLLAAAGHLAYLDPALARETYLEALMCAIFTGHPCAGEDSPARLTARAAKAAPPAPQTPRALDLVLDALVARFTEGYRTAVPLLRDAVREFRKEDAGGTGDLRLFWLCAHIARDLFDAESNECLAGRQVEVLRAEGMLALLPRALSYHARVEAARGRIDEAAAALEEADAITSATGAPPRRYIEPFLAAYRGDEALALELVREGAGRATASGEAQALRVVRYSAALLHNSLGQYPAALAAARLAAEFEDDLGTHGAALAEVVEAAARCGEHEIAADAFDRLVERTGASGTTLALGLTARSRALLSTGPAAGALYREAIAHLEHSGERLWLARTRLIHGEWLRRANHRTDARAQLSAALELFTRIRADGFTDRARRELLATGEPAGVPGSLTAHERHIARLAAEGHTNREIAEQLVISPRTVAWHLSKIFAKLGVSSRRRLRNALARD